MVLGAISLWMDESPSALFGPGLIWTVCGVPAVSALVWSVIDRLQRRRLDARPQAAVRWPLAEAVAALNDMAPEMAASLSGMASVRVLGPTCFMLEVGSAGELISIQDGHVVKIVTATALELLPNERREHLQTHAASLSHTHLEWAKLYTRRNRARLPFVRRRIDEQLRQLAAGTKEHLDGVVSVLQSLGLKPDDHYMQLRGLVSPEGVKSETA
jgi:hypothetical protein